jgi:hypothetical protein
MSARRPDSSPDTWKGKLGDCDVLMIEQIAAPLKRSAAAASAIAGAVRSVLGATLVTLRPMVTGSDHPNTCAAGSN